MTSPADVSPGDLPELPEPPLSLRERKKQRTREAIRREAYRLFREQGYDATTVDQIAAAAEISPSTFFRYFPTKEEVVLTDEYDPIIMEALRRTPADLSLVAAVREALLGTFRVVYLRDREEMTTRMRLVATQPELRRRVYAQQNDSWNALLEAYAERSGRAADDPHLRYAIAATGAVVSEAIMAWGDSGCVGDPGQLMDEALTFLESGLREP